MEFWTLALLTQRTRSLLEWSAVEGDSPVGVFWGEDSGDPEYRASDIARELGRHGLPTLNTTRDR